MPQNIPYHCCRCFLTAIVLHLGIVEASLTAVSAFVVVVEPPPQRQRLPLPRGGRNKPNFRSSAATTRSSQWQRKQIVDDDAMNPVASLGVLENLVPKSEIAALAKMKSNKEGAAQLCFHLGLYAAAASLLPTTVAGSVLAMAFVGSFFFTGMHEMVHRTAFRSRAANDVFGQFLGFLCMRPARHYLYYHWQHHKYTGNPDLDSELQPGSFLDLPVETPLGYLFYVSGIPFWIDAVSTLCRHALGRCTEPYLSNHDRARREVVVEARAYLFLYASIFARACFGGGRIRTALVRLWILPALLGQPFLRFYLLAEHRGRKQSPLIYENTRTMETNWLYRKLAWEMPYHTEHHAWPSVPFHKLEDVRALLLSSANDGERADLVAVSGGGGGGEIDDVRAFSDRGELYPELRNSNGYIRFNWRFLKRLFG